MSPISSARFQAAIADRYVIDNVLGRGGMGTVYLARDVRHGRQVAIKVVFPEIFGPEGSAKFLREIRLTARLQHPHILPLLDSGEAAGCPYYVMPYVKGGSLRSLLNKKARLSIREALDIAGDIAEALHYAHENRIIHCDIKPENILLSGGHAVVADFGISRAYRPEPHAWARAESSTSAGTPAYVSPEQASGEPVIDARADVYSLACVIFEMIAGHPPFHGETDMAMVSKRFTTPPPDLGRLVPYVPRGIAFAVRRAMSVDSARRYRTTYKFAKSLENGASRGARPFLEILTLSSRRLTGAVGRISRAASRRSRNTAQDLITRSRDSLDSVRLGAKASSGSNLRGNTLG